MTRRIVIALVILVLGACGLKGDPEPPPGATEADASPATGRPG